MSEESVTRLEVEPNLPDDFTLPSSVRHIQFDERLSESDLTKLGRELHHRPEITLRVYGHSAPRAYTDLDFLYHFPNVRDLAIDLWSLMNIGGLRAIRDLDSFTFGETKTKRHSLSFLSRFAKLRRLYIEGHSKDIDVIEKLKDLEKLTLRCITLQDLKLLTGLTKLKSIEIKLGGTTNLDALRYLPQLRHPELTWIRGLEDLSVIGKLHSLESLHIRALRNVKELPSFRDLRSLRVVYLETMKGLSDLRSVADAPILEKLTLSNLPRLNPRSLRCFLGHPTLREFGAGLGSFKRNAYAEALLGLPPKVWLPPGAREKAYLEIMTENAKRSVN
jgi:hypothetical protein